MAAPAWADRLESLATWYGSYVFDGAAGQTVGGSPITYHYTLVLGREQTEPKCTLHLEGYQQDEMLRCTVLGDRKDLGVAFGSYANGSLVNAYGVRVFAPGVVLFRLTRTGTGDHVRIMTSWLALHPDGVAETGVFFRRDGG